MRSCPLNLNQLILSSNCLLSSSRSPWWYYLMTFSHQSCYYSMELSLFLLLATFEGHARITTIAWCCYWLWSEMNCWALVRCLEGQNCLTNASSDLSYLHCFSTTALPWAWTFPRWSVGQPYPAIFALYLHRIGYKLLQSKRFARLKSSS